MVQKSRLPRAMAKFHMRMLVEIPASMTQSSSLLMHPRRQQILTQGFGTPSVKIQMKLPDLSLLQPWLLKPFEGWSSRWIIPPGLSLPLLYIASISIKSKTPQNKLVSPNQVNMRVFSGSSWKTFHEKKNNSWMSKKFF